LRLLRGFAMSRAVSNLAELLHSMSPVRTRGV
jgi:hypothetical protein